MKDSNHSKSAKSLAKKFFKNLKVRMKLCKQLESRDKS